MSNIAITVKTLTTFMLNAAKSLAASSRRLALNIWLHPFWRNKLSKQNQHQSQRLSVEEATALLEVRIWAFVVVAVTIILLLWWHSVTFVTQPIKSMAPIDQAYTKMLNDIVLLIVGGIGGVIGKRAMSSSRQAFTPPQQPMCQPMMASMATATTRVYIHHQRHPKPAIWRNAQVDQSRT
jgi:hypothetical protein